jgi:hypothetical protein
MNTDDLIERLATDLSPAPRRAFERRLTIGLPIGMLASGLIVWLGYGLRADFPAVIGTPMLWVKFAWPAVVAWIAWRLIERLATPGRSLGRLQLALWAPAAAMSALAAAAWFGAQPTERVELLMGSTWSAWIMCIASIVLSALPILAAGRWALARAAPTDLPRTGAAAGLLAGALGTMVYALHCPELDAPFLLVWNGLGMVLAAALGAVLAPRLMRW